MLHTRVQNKKYTFVYSPKMAKRRKFLFVLKNKNIFTLLQEKRFVDRQEKLLFCQDNVKLKTNTFDGR